MKTTGSSFVDNVFNTENSISSSHVVVAEFNINSYYDLSNFGCYLGSASSVASGATSYSSSNVGNKYDNGNHKLTFTSSSGSKTYKDDPRRKDLSPLRDCFGPNRADAGILYPIVVLNRSKKLSGTTGYIRQQQFANSSSRVYPLSESSVFKYWNSFRNVSGSGVGLSSAAKNISTANPFVVYSNSFKSNKITIKTQVDGGYPTVFRVQYLDSSNNWQTALNVTSASTHFSTGQLDIAYDGTSWYRVTESLPQTYLTEFSDSTNKAVTMKGLRLLVTSMSSASSALQLIEMSPRLVCNITNYVESFNINSTIGDMQNGLPLGSIVSSSGDLMLSNTTRAFDKMNKDSIFTYIKNSSSENYELETMLRSNVKISFYQILRYSSNEYAIPLKTMYTEEWLNNSDFSTSVSLQDYIKFFKESVAPDLLLGYSNPTKGSLAIRILLDSIGYNKFSFETTDSIDPTMKFFFCNNEVSVAEALNDIAQSLQLSMFMDADNNFVVMTKERVLSKQAFNINNNKINGKNYWFIGSQTNQEDEELPEYGQINFINSGVVYPKIPNVESFSQTAIPPVTDGSVSYTTLDIPRQPYAFVTESDKDKLKDLKKKSEVDASIVYEDLSYSPTILWQSGDNPSESSLLSGALTHTIEASKRPKNALSGVNIVAANENDAVREAFGNLLSGYSYKDLIINLNEDTTSFFLASGKYAGYVYIDNEVIKYRGIYVQTVNSQTSKKSSAYLFSQEEFEELKASLPSGSDINPSALIIDMDFKISGRPTLDTSNYTYRIVSDGRGQEGTLPAKHVARTDKTIESGWVTFATVINDKSKDALRGTKATMDVNQNYGTLKLTGPSSLKGIDSKYLTTASVKQLTLPDEGSRFIHGFYKNLDFAPEKFGTRMRIVDKNAVKTKSSANFMGGLAFHLSTKGSTGTSTRRNYVSGYFIEVESVGSEGVDKVGNIRLYRMTTLAGSTECTVLGFGSVNVSATTNTGLIERSSAERRSEDGQSTDVFDLDVVVKTVKGIKYFYVNWQGVRVFVAKDPTTNSQQKIPPSGKFGVFVRGDSITQYDYLYGLAQDADIQEDIDPVFGGSKNTLSKMLDRLTFSNTDGKEVYFEDFTTLVREARKYTVRFDQPVFDSLPLDLSKVNSDYLVKKYKSSSFGAEFWVYNTSNGLVGLGQEGLSPLFISGIALQNISNGEVTFEDYIKNLDANDEYDILQNEFYNNKRTYGNNSVSVATEYLSGINEAESLVSWIIKNASKERKQISLGVFTNPLVELGDKVGIYYPEMGYEIDNIGDKTYVVSEISLTVSSEGPASSVILRECV